MCTTDNENVGLSPMLLATARCSQGSHPSLLPSMATLRTPSRRRAYHHADRPWIGGACGLYGLSQTRRKQNQRSNVLQLVGTSIPSSAAMVTGIFTQRRYRGGEEDTVFTVSNQSKRLKKYNVPLFLDVSQSTRWHL